MRTRDQVRGLFLLSFSCGTLNMISFTRGLVFITGMSGNTMLLSLNFGSGNWETSALFIAIYATFCAGTLFSYWAFETSRLSWFGVPLLSSVLILCSEAVEAIPRDVAWGTVGVERGYPVSEPHWSLLLLSFSAAMHNEQAERLYGYPTVTFLTKTSAKLVKEAADVVVGRREADLPSLLKKAAVVTGFAAGCFWLGVYNVNAPLSSKYWVGSSAAAAILLNTAADATLMK